MDIKKPFPKDDVDIIEDVEDEGQDSAYQKEEMEQLDFFNNPYQQEDLYSTKKLIYDTYENLQFNTDQRDLHILDFHITNKLKQLDLSERVH